MSQTESPKYSNQEEIDHEGNLDSNLNLMTPSVIRRGLCIFSEAGMNLY